MRIVHTGKRRFGCGKTLLVSLVILVLATVIGFFMLENSTEFFMKRQYPIQYQDIIEEEAQKYELDPALVYAVVKAESNFDPDAQSRAGALGLMQITPPTFEWLQTKLPGETLMEKEALLDPATNIRYGCYLLSILLGIYPELQTAISAYNAGMGTVDGWLADEDISPDGVTLRTIPYPETEHYSRAVLENYRIYKELYDF